MKIVDANVESVRRELQKYKTLDENALVFGSVLNFGLVVQCVCV